MEIHNEEYRGYTIRVAHLQDYLADVCDDEGNIVEGTGLCASQDKAIAEARRLTDRLLEDQAVPA